MMVHIFKFLSSPGHKPPRPNPYQVPISFKTQLNLKEYFGLDLIDHGLVPIVKLWSPNPFVPNQAPISSETQEERS